MDIELVDLDDSDIPDRKLQCDSDDMDDDNALKLEGMDIDDSNASNLQCLEPNWALQQSRCQL